MANTTSYNSSSPDLPDVVAHQAIAALTRSDRQVYALAEGLAFKADPDVRATLAALATVREVADLHLAFVVARAREEGLSWAEVGDELGISRQAAQQRYGR